MNKTVAFHTLGCKLNFAETSAMAQRFEQNGFTKITFDEIADVYVINTCSVTEDADRECRHIVRKALRNNPDGYVIVAGCYAQLKPHEIAKIKGVDLVVGASEKFNLVGLVKDTTKKEIADVHSCAINDVTSFTGAYSQSDRTRAFLKIQDGCSYTCSYCTIPMARGASRSDSVSNIVKNAREIAARGIQEIVLTGVNIGDFGSVPKASTVNDRPENFFELIKALDTVEGIARYRISSIEPNLLTSEIIEFVAQSERFVPHFHIPLQSGSNKTLANMRRRYKKEVYESRVREIKSLLPHCCIGSDVIVGFPGETEDDFMETYNFIDSLPISYLHVFTYSERDNTDALKIIPVVPIEKRRKRNRILRTLSDVKQVQFYKENLNQMHRVLFEHQNKYGFMYGYTDNYIRVKIKYDEQLAHKLCEVDLTGIDQQGEVLCQIPVHEEIAVNI